MNHSDSSEFESVKDCFEDSSTDSEDEMRGEKKLLNAILLSKFDKVKTILSTMNDYEKKVKINAKDAN